MKYIQCFSRALLPLSLLAFSFSVFAQTTPFSGEWTGQYSCTSPGSQAAPISVLVKLVVQGSKATMTRDTPTIYDSVSGIITDTGNVVLEGGGSAKAQNATPWRVRLEGKFQGRTFIASGVVDAPDGSKKYRDCTLALYPSTTTQETAQSKPSISNSPSKAGNTANVQAQTAKDSQVLGESTKQFLKALEKNLSRLHGQGQMGDSQIYEMTVDQSRSYAHGVVKPLNCRPDPEANKLSYADLRQEEFARQRPDIFKSPKRPLQGPSQTTLRSLLDVGASVPAAVFDHDENMLNFLFGDANSNISSRKLGGAKFLWETFQRECPDEIAYGKSYLLGVRQAAENALEQVKAVDQSKRDAAEREGKVQEAKAQAQMIREVQQEAAARKQMEINKKWRDDRTAELKSGRAKVESFDDAIMLHNPKDCTMLVIQPAMGAQPQMCVVQGIVEQFHRAGDKGDVLSAKIGPDTFFVMLSRGTTFFNTDREGLRSGNLIRIMGTYVGAESSPGSKPYATFNAKYSYQ